MAANAPHVGRLGENGSGCRNAQGSRRDGTPPRTIGEVRCLPQRRTRTPCRPGLAPWRPEVQAAPQGNRSEPRRLTVPPAAMSQSRKADDGATLEPPLPESAPPSKATRIERGTSAELSLLARPWTPHGGGRVSGASGMPTERPRTLRRRQDPPAPVGPPPAPEGVAAGRAARGVLPARAASRGPGKDHAGAPLTACRGLRPTVCPGVDDKSPSSMERCNRLSQPSPAQSPSALSSPCPPAGGRTHNTSPRPLGEASGGPSPTGGEPV